MKKSTIIVTLLIASCVLASLHWAAIDLGWYFNYPEIDVAMHLLGGFVMAIFGYSLLATYRGSVPPSEQSALYMFWFTLFVAVFWEVFEFQFQLASGVGMSPDTIMDILFGLSGAGLAWSFLYGIKKPLPFMEAEKSTSF